MKSDNTTRRELFINAALGGAGMACSMLPCWSARGSENMKPADVNAEQAIKLLKDGNERFVAGKSKHVHSDVLWRSSLLTGQHPFAVILGCADSRVPVELVFDEGFGDLFVIRNAGNIVMGDVIGSIEYAVAHLHTPLVVVMGHESCGAVTAALMTREKREREPIELQDVLRHIDPAIGDLNQEQDDVLHAAVEANVRWSVDQLRVRLRAELSGSVALAKIVGSVYELNTGRVRFLE